MPRQKPVIRHQDELDWEGWTDPDLAAKSPCRWRLLVTGERDASSGLVSGIAELPPGVSLPLHHPPRTRGNLLCRQRLRSRCD